MHVTAPRDTRALVAIDLGAESCRVSLLRWSNGRPEIKLVYRFANNAVQRDDGLHWDSTGILAELDAGLRRCAEVATEGIRSIAVDGWAVDYVRLDSSGNAIAEPFCYRDTRTAAAEIELHTRISAARMREITGIQLLALNSVYQMAADDVALRQHRWLNLPEYVLYKLGARPVAEFTNATHTQMVGLDGQWSSEILEALGAPIASMPTIVPPGTEVGFLTTSLSDLSAFSSDVRLIAPACHDTASAIAAIPDGADDWAYISSGTWSLVGTPVTKPINTTEARARNFTNFGGVDDTFCFHKNVNGMWLIRQCLECWNSDDSKPNLTIGSLVVAAANAEPASFVLAVDDPELLLPGHMPLRINAQLRRRGLPEFDISPAAAPQVASLIFHSLAACYAEVLQGVALITGKQLRKLYIMGGGSQNKFLNHLTAQATALRVIPAGVECSTTGNFASQLAALEQTGGARPTSLWASFLVSDWPDV